MYSVDLWRYTETAAYNRAVYWGLFLSLTGIGAWKLLWTRLKPEKEMKTTTAVSLMLRVSAVLYLVMAREAYAASIAILLMIGKGLLVFRGAKPYQDKDDCR